METNKNSEVGDPLKTPNPEMDKSSHTSVLEDELLQDPSPGTVPRGDSPLSDEGRMEEENAQHDAESTTSLEDSVRKLQLKAGDKVKLNGAARKRFKWLMSHGHSAEEARSLAIQKLNPAEKPTKRGRSEDTTPRAEGSKKRARTDVPTPSGEKERLARTKAPKAQSYKQALEAVKIALLPRDFPQTLLTEEQLGSIQEAVLEEILQAVDVKPSFLGTTFKPGWLLLRCANRDTSEWIRKIAPTLKPWEGADLRAVEESEFPRSQLMVGYFPNSSEDDNERVLKLIARQNEGLDVSNWRVLNTRKNGTVLTMTLSIDLHSAEVLKGLSYKANFKFGQVTLRPTSGRKEAGNMGEASEPQAGPSGSSTAASDGKALAKEQTPSLPQDLPNLEANKMPAEELKMLSTALDTPSTSGVRTGKPKGGRPQVHGRPSAGRKHKRKKPPPNDPRSSGAKRC